MAQLWQNRGWGVGGKNYDACTLGRERERERWRERERDGEREREREMERERDRERQAGEGGYIESAESERECV